MAGLEDPGWENVEADLSPYIHWYEAAEGRAAENSDFQVLRSDPALDPFVRSGRDVRSGYAIPGSGGDLRIPMPKAMRNSGWESPESVEPWPSAGGWKDALPDTLPDGTVLVGIIDSGIPLGHRRFRRADGSSRVVASWQQSAVWDAASQPWLPFGQEISASEINALLKAHSNPAKLMGRLDQEAFDRAARLVERDRIRGHRDLDHRVSHGAHMAGLAAGADPLRDRAFSEHALIVAVNLPPQPLHGSAGNFLQYFAAYAARRIEAIARATAEKAGVQQGIPTFVNMSYGMAAGPRDGPLPLEELMIRLIEDRRADGMSAPLKFHLPAGNENLDRQVAVLRLAENVPAPLPPWRVLPADATSNVIELWVDAEGQTIENEEMTVSVTPPGGTPHHAVVDRLSTDAYVYRDLLTMPSGAPMARLYAARVERFEDGKAPTTRLHLLIALAPTGHWDTAVPRASAGLWHVALCCEKRCRVDIAIQSDQSAFRHSRQGRQSYFDDSDYARFLPSGHPMDSYAYPCKTKAIDCLLEDGTSPVTRLGTINALTTQEKIAAVGGYHAVDGRPAIYSSTAAPQPNAAAPIAQIAAAYPTEDSPLLFGVLGSGARDGGAVALRGTSSASAMATRAAALEGIGKARLPQPIYPPAHPDKVGRTPEDDGREARTDVSRVARFPSYL